MRALWTRLEQVIGRPLPQDFAESWSIHDGQEQHVEMAWLPSGGRLGSIERIIEEYQRSYANEPVDPEAFEWLNVPDLVRGQLSHPGRIPISGSEYTEGNNNLFT
jgi:cell wall assembly regulator SMI1